MKYFFKLHCLSIVFTISSCSFRSRSAQLELEIKYEHAVSLLKENKNEAALESFVLLCQNEKHWQSCSNAGSIFHKNNNLSEAKKNFLLGCENDDGFGCFGLGIILEKADPILSKSFILKSCDLNFELACKFKSEFH